jgi:hypothetical protein
MDKVFAICLLFLMYLGTAFGQTKAHPNGLTYKFVLTDYNTLDSYFQNNNQPDRILHPDDLNYAGEIGYFRSFNSSLNLGIPLRIGSIDAHHAVYDDSLCQPCTTRIKQEFFFGADIVAQYKFNNNYILKEDFVVAPYLIAGVGFKYLTERSGNIDVQIPLGLGVNIKLSELFYLQAQFEYRKSLIVQKDNLAISAGLNWMIEWKPNASSNPKNND